MSTEAVSKQFDRDAVFQSIVEILQSMTADWDMDYGDGINDQTALISDLSFESIDVVQFIVALEERFGRRDLPFHELLMENGRYVDELRVGEIVDFMHQQLSTTNS